MPPSIIHRALDFDPGQSSGEFDQQWTAPRDVFTILLLLGGDVIQLALAQLSGSLFTPVAFSFGWVAYAVSAVVVAVGENRLLPPPDCACKVINAKNGYIHENRSWVLGRIVRDFDHWSHPEVKRRVTDLLDGKFEYLQREAKAAGRAASEVDRPPQAGLCIAVYRAVNARKGFPGRDLVYWSGFVVIPLQLGVAAIPAGLYGDWAVLLVTVCGTLLSLITGALPQWKKEKWACDVKPKKTFILTRGEGSQHAVVIISDGAGFDLEQLATGSLDLAARATVMTRVALVLLGMLSVVLLITAAGIQQNTWFLLAVGAIGMLQNIFIAGKMRWPENYGIDLEFVEVFAEPKVMQALYAVETAHYGVGSSMVGPFFPGKLRDDEKAKWAEFAARKAT